MKSIRILYFIGLLSSSLHGLDPEILRQYVMALFDTHAQNYESAQRRYASLPEDKPLDIYKGYIQLLNILKKYDAIINLIPLFEGSFVQDPDFQFIIAQTLTQKNRSKEADNLFITIHNRFKDNQEIAYQTVHVYLRRQEPENALSVIDTLLQNSPQRPNNSIFYFLKSQIYIQLNQLDNARKTIKACLDLFPNFEKGWLMLARIQEQTKHIKDALNGYIQFLQLSQTYNKKIEQHLLQLFLQNKIKQQNKTSLSVPQKYIANAQHLFSQKKYHEALKFLDTYLDKQK